MITSRTQHFLSDKEVELALTSSRQNCSHRQMFKLYPSNEQIQRFLVRKLGSEEAAARRFALLEE